MTTPACDESEIFYGSAFVKEALGGWARCFVTAGIVTSGMVRIMRKGVVLHEGELLFHGTVREDTCCDVVLSTFTFLPGDLLHCYRKV